MKKQSVWKKRLVKDLMLKPSLEATAIKITKVLKKSCRAAYRQYIPYLDEEKEKAVKNRWPIKTDSG